jgi:hypothetical protein
MKIPFGKNLIFKGALLAWMVFDGCNARTHDSSSQKRRREDIAFDCFLAEFQA